MHTLLPRLLASVATAVVTWLCLFFEHKLNVTVSHEEKDAMISLVVGAGMVAYSMTHRLLSKRMNPADHTVAPAAASQPGRPPESLSE